MSNIGILAYGSLIEDPGSEINPLISEHQTVETPFCIEFARSSSSRNNLNSRAIVTRREACPPICYKVPSGAW